MKVFFILLGAAAALTLSQPRAFAQQKPWPEKTVRMVVPFPPAGGTDITARLVAPRLADELKQQFIIDNRPGAGATIGAEAVARATPDGYTIIMVSASYATGAALYKLPYDPEKGIAPVSIVGMTAELLLVHPSLPVRTVKQLVDLARTKPKAINYGSSGVGGFTHLETELLNQMAKVQTTHVPYKGTALALSDLVGGQIELLFASAPSAIGFVKHGRLRAIGISSAKRMAVAPDVPAISETVPGYAADLWYGVWAPAGTPRAIIDRLNQTLAKIVQMPEVRERLLREGIEPMHSSPEEFGKFISGEVEKWTRVVKTGNIKLE